MKKITILIILFCLMSGLPSAAQTQICSDRDGHTTDPDNPSDDHRVNLPANLPYNLWSNKDINDPSQPKLDWRTDFFSQYFSVPNTTLPDWCSNIENPFFNDNESVNVDHLYDANPILRDNKPEDGWEMLGFDFGINYHGTVSNISHPYLVLYNKHTGIMRVFYYLTANYNQDYTEAVIKIGFDIADGESDYQSANLNHMEEVAKPLDFYNKHQTEMVPNTVYAGLKTSTKCDEGMWLHADFVMAYDPCVCKYEYQRLKIEFAIVKQANVQLNGDLQSTPVTKTPGSSGSVDVTSAYKTGFKNVSGTVKGAKTSYKNTKEVVTFAYSTISKYSDPDKDLSTLLKLGKTIPYLGAAIGVFNFFVIPEEKDKEAKPVTYNSTVNISGTITDSAYTNPIKIEIPGSDYWAKSNTSNQIGNVPLYDEPMGVISLVNTPTIEFRHANAGVVGSNGDFVPVHSSITQPIVTEYKIVDDLQFALNPSSELEVEEIKMAVVLTYNNQNTKDFEHTLDNGNLNHYPYIPGAKIHHNWLVTPNVRTDFHYSHEGWLKTKNSMGNLELQDEYLLYKVSYGQAPVSCFKDRPFYLISSPELTPTKPKLVLRMNALLKHPVTGRYYKFVHSYIIDEAKFEEKNEEQLFYLVGDLEFEDEEETLLRKMSQILHPVIGPHPSVNYFNSTGNILDFQVFENETIGGQIDAWTGIEIKDNVTILPGTSITAGNYIEIYGENDFGPDVHMQIGSRDPNCLVDPNSFVVSDSSDLHTFCTSLSPTIYDYNPVANKREEIIEKKDVAARSLNFSLYPNPTDDLANISLPELEEGSYTLTVLDLSGMTIFSETRAYTIGGEQTFAIGTADYTSGIYFVTLSQGDLTKTKKLVIAK